MLELGVYEHFKGMKCRVIGVARHSESLEEFVVYEELDGKNSGSLWVRPLVIFLEEVEVQGKNVPRFKKLR